MLYLLILFVIISIVGIKICDNSKEYLFKNQTQAIKGFFTMIIFFSHFNQYANFDNSITNNIYILIIKKVGQLMVTMYLFYSGYGIIKSMQTKKDYIKNFPKNRVLKILITFDCAIILYIITNTLLNDKYSLKTTLLSFIGWESIGNSNWYIFVLLMLYLIIYFSGKLSKGKANIKFLLTNLLFDIMLITLLYFTKKEHWYNIILTFPLGLLYGIYEKQIKKVLDNYYLVTLILMIVCFVGTYISNSFIAYEIKAIFFTLIIVFLSYRIKIGNKTLEFLGKYTFEIYILQRIPDMIYSNLNINYILFFILSIVTTIIISFVFKKLTNLAIQSIYKII